MPFTAPNYQEIYNQENTSLEAYYALLLQQEQGDLNRVRARLEEDYQRGNRITYEDFAKDAAYATETAGASRQEADMQAKREQRALQGNLVQRGVSEGGVAQQLTEEQTSREQLRREAIERALTKTQKDLQYTKERSLEQEAIKKLRGGEDVSSQWAKFQTEKGQERQEKALNLAGERYGREFTQRSTEESFRLQNEAMNR